MHFQLQRNRSVCARLQGRRRYAARSRSGVATRPSARPPAPPHAHHQQHERDAEILRQQHGQQRGDDADAPNAPEAQRGRDAARVDPPKTSEQREQRNEDWKSAGADRRRQLSARHELVEPQLGIFDDAPTCTYSAL